MKKIFLIILLITSQNLLAESIFIKAVERYETRKSAQWLLIQPERKFGLFEQWFSFNAAEKFRSNIWEFFIGFDYGGTTQDDSYMPSFDPDDNVFGLYGTAYYSIFGLGFKREKAIDTFKQWEIIGEVRLLGFNTQTTNLIFQLGNRWYNDDMTYDDFSNFFVGIDTQLYIFRFLGAQFNWRSYFSGTGDSGRGYSSTRLSLSIFAEVDFMRFYFTWWTENFNEDIFDRDAGLFGIRLYY
jgi:hypothetical protein